MRKFQYFEVYERYSTITNIMEVNGVREVGGYRTFLFCLLVLQVHLSVQHLNASYTYLVHLKYGRIVSEVINEHDMLFSRKNDFTTREFSYFALR